MLFEPRRPATQRTLLNLNSGLSNKGYVAEIKKNIKSAKAETKNSPKESFIKKTIKDFFLDPENHQQSSLLSSSKKIQKIRGGIEPKKDVYETIYKDTYSSLLGRSLEKQKSFLEDDIKKTRNYNNTEKVNLTYMNKTTGEKQEFFCFHERDLKIPEKFAQKSISYSCDNDCATDDEQIKGAVKTLVASLEEMVKIENQ